MICEQCGAEMQEEKIIGFKKAITVFWECPECGFELDNDDDQ